MQHEYTILLPDDVVALWPRIKELLEPAIPYANGELDIDDILEMVNNRQAFISVMYEDGVIVLVIVGEVLTYPKKSVLNILALGGTKLDVMMSKFLPALKNIAKQLGASAIRGYCRPSVERLFRRIGGGASRIYAVLETGV